MARIKCDHRSTEYTALPEVHERLVTEREGWIRGEIRRARDFQAILQSGHYLEERCASLTEYARKIGYEGNRAFHLARLGSSLSLEAGIEEALVEGRMSLECAFQLWEVLSDDELRVMQDWMSLAQSLSPRGLKSYVTRAKEERAQGTTEFRLVAALVTLETHEDYKRLKHVVEVILGKKLTYGQFMAWIVNDCLERHDPVRRANRLLKKKLAEKGLEMASPDSAALEAQWQALIDDIQAKNRDIPETMAQILVVRAEGRCEVAGCTNEGKPQAMHLLVPWSDGKLHDLRNIALGCPLHHKLVDSGAMKCIGFAPGGRPIFEDDKGERRYPEPRPPPSEKSGE